MFRGLQTRLLLILINNHGVIERGQYAKSIKQTIMFFFIYFDQTFKSSLYIKKLKREKKKHKNFQHEKETCSLCIKWQYIINNSNIF